MSNTSRDLSISVSTISDSPKLSGTRISVKHSLYGVLYSHVINAVGAILDPSVTDPTTKSDILLQLKRFGFYVTFAADRHISGNQLAYLITLDGLHFEKLRKMNVIIDDKGNVEPRIVGFITEHHPKWLANTYLCPRIEYLDGLQKGTAIDITEISNTQLYDWTWLDFVANIKDILDDNSYVPPNN